MRWNAATDHNQASIVDALRKVGAHVEIIGRPVDLLVGYNRQWIPMEVKQPGGRLTPTQDDFFEATAKRGLLAVVVRSASEALAVIGCESRGVEVGPRIMSSPWLDGTGGAG